MRHSILPGDWGWETWYILWIGMILALMHVHSVQSCMAHQMIGLALMGGMWKAPRKVKAGVN